MKKIDVISELTAIACADASDFVFIDSDGCVCLKPLSKIPKSKRKALALIKNNSSKGGIEIKLYDKMKALELLGKAYGVFSDCESDSTEVNEKFDEIMKIIGGDE